MAHIGICSGHCQSVQNVPHVVIASISGVINTQQTTVGGVSLCLIKDTQHHVKPVPTPGFYRLTEVRMKSGYLNDDTIMCQAVHKGVGQALSHDVVIIVTRLVADVKHGLLDITNLVS